MVLMSSAEPKEATGKDGQHVEINEFYTDPWWIKLINCSSQRMLKHLVVQYQQEDNQ